MSGRLRDDVAWEYLDDGGVLFCQMSEGAYWQLGPPSGALLAHLLAPGAGADAVAQVLGIFPVEVPAALEAFRETLVVLALLDPAPDVAQDGGPGSVPEQGDQPSSR